MSASGNAQSVTASAPLSRGVELALFLTSMAWVGAAKAIAEGVAQKVAVRLHVEVAQIFLEGVLLVLLLVVGFQLLDRIATRGAYLSQALPLPRRATRFREWSVGAAVGWGVCLLAVLPVLLSGNLHAQLSVSPSHSGVVAISLATLLVVVLAEELIFRGYPFQRLIGAIGPSWAALVLSLGFGLTLVSATSLPHHVGLAILDGTLFGLLLAMAWLRTHGLWVGWGLHFAYRAVMAVILGLPIAGHGAYGALADSYTAGPRWLSGGAYGLDAALLTAVAMLAGLAILYRCTRDWAWEYTFRELVPAGYEVDVAPPAAHAAMESAAPALVQILSVTPQSQTLPTLPRQDVSVP